MILFVATLALAALIVCSGWLYVKFWAPYLDVDLEYHLANYDDDEDEPWPEHLGASHRPQLRQAQLPQDVPLPCHRLGGYLRIRGWHRAHVH